MEVPIEAIRVVLDDLVGAYESATRGRLPDRKRRRRMVDQMPSEIKESFAENKWVRPTPHTVKFLVASSAFLDLVALLVEQLVVDD